MLWVFGLVGHFLFGHFLRVKVWRDGNVGIGDLKIRVSARVFMVEKGRRGYKRIRDVTSFGGMGCCS